MRWIVALLLIAAAPAAGAPRDWVAAHRVPLLREYLELLAIPNVASDRVNIRRNADHIVAMMVRRGLSPRLLESEDGAAPPLIYGEWRVPGATRTYILYAHYDGQPVTPEDWRVTPPFQPLLLTGPAGTGAPAEPDGAPAGDPGAHHRLLASRVARTRNACMLPCSGHRTRNPQLAAGLRLRRAARGQAATGSTVAAAGGTAHSPPSHVSP